MKGYPKVNTLEVILNTLQKEFFITPSIELTNIIKAEIENYKKATVENVNPYPKEFIEGRFTDKDGKIRKGIVVKFLNPFKFVEIVDENNNIVKPSELPEIELIDSVALWIDLEDSFNTQIFLLTNNN